jgi:hypothetical protein
MDPLYKCHADEITWERNTLGSDHERTRCDLSISLTFWYTRFTNMPWLFPASTVQWVVCVLALILERTVLLIAIGDKTVLSVLFNVNK